MHPDRWQQISQIYRAAVTRHPRDRAGFLREACAGDDALQQDVASLLTNENQASGFLSEAAFAAAAGIVSRPDGTMLTGRRQRRNDEFARSRLLSGTAPVREFQQQGRRIVNRTHESRRPFRHLLK